MRNLIIFALLFLATSLLSAQPERGRHHKAFADLDLTEAQRTEMATIRKETRERIKTLRAADEPDREAIHELRKATRARFEAVLTTEQREQLAAKRAARKAALEQVDKEALRQDLKAHRSERVEPVLRAARAQFDKQLSAEDRAAVDRLRGVFASKPGRGDRPAGKQGRPSEQDRADRKARMQAWRAEHATELAELKALVTKYEQELTRVEELLAPQRAAWRTERREIRQSHLPEELRRERPGKARKAAARKGQKGRSGKRGGKRGYGAFLLMKA